MWMKREKSIDNNEGGFKHYTQPPFFRVSSGAIVPLNGLDVPKSGPQVQLRHDNGSFSEKSAPMST
jgi:hypothetical protein